MIYYKIVGSEGNYEIRNQDNVLCGKFETRDFARAELHLLASELMRSKAEEATKDGVQTTFEVWTWHDKVMDGDSFVEEYRKEFKK